MKRWDYPSLSAFARDCDALPDHIQQRFSDAAWTGESFADSLQTIQRGGDERNVTEAQALIDQIQAELPECTTRQWSTDIAGAFPCVPAFLSGDPECMFTLADCESPSAPVRIFIASTSSATVSHQTLLKRGAAALALVLLASRSRPVELYSYAHSGFYHGKRKGNRGDAVIVQRLASHPVMLSEVTYILTSAGYARNLTYGVLAYRTNGIDNGLKWGDATVRDNHQAGPATRALLGLNDSDVLIGPAHAHDPLVNDPVGFVRRELEKMGALAK